MKTYWDGMRRRWFRCSLRQGLKWRRFPSTPGVVDLSGYGFTMSFPDRMRWASQVLEVMRDDCYRLRLLPERPMVVDVGANIGTVALAVLWLRPGASVLAVEPSAMNRIHLEKNLALHLGQSCRIIGAAAGVRRGTAKLGGAFSDSYRMDGGGGEVVEVLPLSEVITGPVDLLKMDIEGAEIDALRGAGKSLHQVARVAIEYHDYQGRPSRLRHLLVLLGRAGFDRIEVDSIRYLPAPDASVPESCCLVHAWRMKLGAGS